MARKKVPRYDIVVSAENNHYVAWQAMLFHYSCLKQLGRPPIIVVHSEGSELHAGFHMIRARDGRIQRARNYRHYRGTVYPPRNTAGTLRCVDSDAEYLVLCDPDMLFLSPAPFERYRLGANAVSFDSVSYLTVNDSNEAVLAAACRRLKLSLDLLRDSPLSGGVPHIVPAALRQRLSSVWMRCINLLLRIRLPPHKRHEGYSPWLSSMWGLVLAVRMLRLKPVLTEFAITNHLGHQMIPPIGPTGPYLLHYCYGDAIFDKRRYSGDGEEPPGLWHVQPDKESRSINNRIRAELGAASAFYGLTSG